MSYHHHKVKTGAEIHRDGSGAHQLASETFLPHPCLGLREFLNCCSSHMTPQTVRRTQQVGEISHSLFTVPQYVSKCLRGESCGGMVDIIRPTYTWMIHEEWGEQPRQSFWTCSVLWSHFQMSSVQSHVTTGYRYSELNKKKTKKCVLTDHSPEFRKCNLRTKSKQKCIKPLLILNI